MGNLPMNKQTALERFRAIPEKTCGEWRYRDFGAGTRTFLALPGGELVNDLGFEFALAIGETHRVIYPAYPRTSSIEELADGLRAILDAERIVAVAVLGASFGGAVAQVFVRRHPARVTALILSNTGVPLQYLALPIRVTYWTAKAMPWEWISKLLRKPLLKTVDQSGTDHAFWARYLDELFSTRLTKADMLSNTLNQHDYHCRFRFMPEDLKGWRGRVLIVESDNDVIGPRRREALRRTYPQAQVHTFHKAGHAPLFTRYDEYLRIVREFLESPP
jgi:pimeloyl-ACP methyl ester carboxylesterase